MTPVYFCSICKDHTTGVLAGTLSMLNQQYAYVGCRACYQDHDDLTAWIYQYWCDYLTHEDTREQPDPIRRAQSRWAGPGFIIVRD